MSKHSQALLILLFVAGCPSVSSAQEDIRSAIDIDRIVTEALIPDIMESWKHTTIRVDARPLRPDPGLASFWNIPGEIQDLIPQSSQYFYPDPDSSMARQRQQILTKFGVLETDTELDFECPSLWASIPLPRETAPEHVEGCPDAEFLSVAFSLPRKGSSGMEGVEQSYPIRLSDGLWTVRSLEHSMTPKGGPAATVDYVLTLSNGRIVDITRVNQIIFD